jgi:hypothetical protein
VAFQFLSPYYEGRLPHPKGNGAPIAGGNANGPNVGAKNAALTSALQSTVHDIALGAAL